MSVSFVLVKKVLAVDLFDGRLQKFGVREHFNPSEATGTDRCLTDGSNYLWVGTSENGIVDILTRYFPNGDPRYILRAIAEAFDTEVLCEDDPRYWGFETEQEEQEFMKAWEQQYRDDEERFRAELLKYLLGEPTEFVPGIIEMAEAEIGKRLVKKNPSLLLPENSDKLRNEIRREYRDYDVPF
jgi:hypothetical protein